MKRMKRNFAALLASSLLFAGTPAIASDLSDAINKDYQNHLAPLWDHFHRNPELSLPSKYLC